MSGATGHDLAHAAQRLAGSPFRLRGRDPSVGLDCIGLVLAALAQIGRRCAAPVDYQLRMRDVSRFVDLAARVGLVPVEGEALPGDVLLLQVGPCQHHCAIAAADSGFIHAHAGLRRVVHTPACPEGRLVHHWRLAP